MVHLCFFGTPHQGTNSVAEFLLNLGTALTNSKEASVLRELKLWSPSLIETNQMWVEIAGGFTITSFFEREKYNGVLVCCLTIFGMTLTDYIQRSSQKAPLGLTGTMRPWCLWIAITSISANSRTALIRCFSGCSDACTRRLLH